eukprot:102276-Chlamydomonas_euryale.AAC.3
MPASPPAAADAAGGARRPRMRRPLPKGGDAAGGEPLPCMARRGMASGGDHKHAHALQPLALLPGA